MKQTSIKLKKRILTVFALATLLLTLLTFRLGWVMVIDAEEYSKLASVQQTRDVAIAAKRGKILDRNGKELAISAAIFSVWARPNAVKYVKNGSEDEAAAQIRNTAATLSSVLKMDYEEVYGLITSEKSLVKVAKYVDKEDADKIRELKLKGIELSEEVKRYYPNGAFAAHLLGSVTDDNNGLAGIELKYNSYLRGVSGRQIKNADKNGEQLSYGVEKYYAAEDGFNLTLTIDEVIQHYVQKAIEETYIQTSADRVMCVAMDPKTAEILAMAMTPSYDPNNPRVALEADSESFSEMTSEEQLDYLNRMWRNPMVSDVYEPGSTSKLITTAIALEEGLTNMNEGFYCPGKYQVAGVELKCWRYPASHGSENLVQAVENSCNPVFATLASRIGLTRFYEYLELFGMTQKTGIDYPGEAQPILQSKDSAGPVGLATMSYGQGIAVNMIQQLTAISCFGNDGVLMEPHIAKGLTDSEGNVVEEFGAVPVRRVVSSQTAADMRRIMESVVSEGGGGNAKVPGYKVGGKTGTANKPSPQGGYSEETYSSFIGMAPMDDPKIALLVVVDNPKGVKYGSTTAAPCARTILSETLRYFNIEPEYTDEEKQLINSKKATVPDVSGLDADTAIGRLAGNQLGYILSPTYEGEGELTIVDQYPKAGERVDTGSSVYIYWQ